MMNQRRIETFLREINKGIKITCRIMIQCKKITKRILNRMRNKSKSLAKMLEIMMREKVLIDEKVQEIRLQFTDMI